MTSSKVPTTGAAPGHSRRRALHLAFTALAVAVLAQMVRVLFPIMFEIGEDWDFIAAGVVALAVFAAPLLALPLLRLPPDTSLASGATLMAASLLVVRLAEPIPAWLAIALVAGALLGATLSVAGLPAGPATPPSWTASAVIAGLALDTTVKAAFGTWDLPWQTTGTSLAVVSIVAAGLVLAAVGVIDSGRSTDATLSTTTPKASWAAGGTFAMLHLLFLSNPGFVASQADIPFFAAVAIVLVGDAVAIAVITSEPRPGSRLPIALGAALGLAAAWLLTSISGITVAAIVPALHVIIAAGLTRAFSGNGSRRVRTGAAFVSMAAGSILFLALVLVWQIYLDRELPLPREALPVIATAVIAAASLRRVPASIETALRPLRSPALVGTAALAVLVPALAGLTQPDAESGEAGSSIRIVNYNIRGSVDIDGQVRPDRVAAEIASSDPDIIVLQEVGRGWPIHATTDLLTYLERSFGTDAVFHRAGDQQFGNVIMSRLPMTEVASDVLPEDGVQERSYLLVTVDTGAGSLAVAGTHLHSRSVPQITAVLDATSSERPLVIAGDMNFAPDDPEVTLFTDAGFTDAVGATGDPCRTTSMEPTSDCDRPDWVFVSEGLTIEEVRIGSGGASDHRAQHVAVRIGTG